MIIGFNWGQIFHFLDLEFGINRKEFISQELLDLIKKEVPNEWLENVRCSGTMSNYQNHNEVGYGETDYLVSMRTQLFNENSKWLERLNLLFLVFKRDSKAVNKLLNKSYNRSYIHDFIKLYKFLGCKTNSFCFNSHMPFIGHSTLTDSLQTLHIINQSTNLIAIELENESYMTPYITGTSNKAEDFQPKIDKFIEYLEDEVIPQIGWNIDRNKEIPFGLSIANESIAKWRYWNKSVLALADRLKADGYKIFLVPHVYTKDYSDISILNDLNNEIPNVGGHEIRITEFNASSEAGNCTQEEAKDYLKRFVKYAQVKGVHSIYYHCLYNVKGQHFSFIK